jgi:hypothetical protein
LQDTASKTIPLPAHTCYRLMRQAPAASGRRKLSSCAGKDFQTALDATLCITGQRRNPVFYLNTRNAPSFRSGMKSLAVVRRPSLDNYIVVAWLNINSRELNAST